MVRKPQEDEPYVSTSYVNVEAVQQAYRRVIQHQEYGRYQGHEEVIVPIWSAALLTRWLERERDTWSG